MSASVLFPVTLSEGATVPPVLDADGLTQVQREHFVDFWLGLEDQPFSLEQLKSELTLWTPELEKRKLDVYNTLEADEWLPKATVRDVLRTLEVSFSLDADVNHPWQGSLVTKTGYALTNVFKGDGSGDTTTVGAHRLMHHLVTGEPLISGFGWQLDHISHHPEKCFERVCADTKSVNVLHLARVEAWRNRYRSTASGGFYWVQPTHCKWGHEKDLSGAYAFCPTCRWNSNNAGKN